jgi:dimethylhistidine N-methyltransferase
MNIHNDDTSLENRGDEVRELLAGLSREQKSVSPKYFYDKRGSELFDRICALPEYYLTRTEIEIMRMHAGDMARQIGPGAGVIEFGIGSGLKTELLLEALESPASFVPVDISEKHLAQTAEALSLRFPALEVRPVTADFTQRFAIPGTAAEPRRNLVYFPGSTIGNFASETALGLLRIMREKAGAKGQLLIGIDLVKPRDDLLRAYNDSQGVTAQFNLNLLECLNREFGANFKCDNFRHEAIYDEKHDRIEMRLVSLARQQVELAGKTVEFDQGERLRTEFSHKYRVQDFREMASKAGFKWRDGWFDRRKWFAVLLFESR